MKNQILRFTLGLALLGTAVTATAQSSFSWNGYNFIAGLANITDASAAHDNATEIAYMTDANVYTIVGNVGSGGGNLVGDFGGGSYYSESGNDIVLVGAIDPGQNYWGTFNVSFELSDGSFTAANTYSDANFINTELNAETLNVVWDNGQPPSTYDPGTVDIGCLLLSIADFNTGGLGVTGIEISSMTSAYPDISFIGVTGPVPEPSTLALAGLGGLSVLLFRRRK